MLDALDLALLEALHDDARLGPLELSRSIGVARATVSSRLQRLQDDGVISGYRAELDLRQAGFTVQAFVTLQIVQGAIDAVRRDLETIPGVLEAYATTGEGDLVCRVAAASHEELQTTLLALNRSGRVARSTSVVILSELVPWRTLPLLRSAATSGAGRSAMPVRP
ncbi:Lrp/AsnC family transcriptional regulator [Jatrophihabitans endophyticus]|uniref:Lrp/AsnC family transcriptional regulator n=1 Tax=Jatrophihabitans endophyticus TaxID=1206085 RepID=UPI001A109E63|nr:Lrp/AsnC family transcriptional regulator [Jatrophihabitans endophyticus]MBE7189059.1 Lrp/AsnC family transcriptional regulator [Jatrophihabitans endophyticus]